MRSVKKFLMQAMILIIFVWATGILLKQYSACRMAYQELGRRISHASVSTENIIYEEGYK